MSACGASCGIGKLREAELRRARDTAERVHPGLRWSTELDSVAPVVAYDEVRRIAATLEATLPVRALVSPGAPGECDSVFVLAGLHRPSLREIADGLVPAPRGAPDSSETYVRVALSPHGRFAVLQEVILSCEHDAAGTLIASDPRPGVVDRRLQGIVRGLQGALRRAGLVVLDLAAVLAPVEGASASAELSATFGEPVSLWSLLFEGTSPMAARVSWVPSAAREAPGPSR